jgi:hypothetical protein
VPRRVWVSFACLHAPQSPGSAPSLPHAASGDGSGIRGRLCLCWLRRRYRAALTAAAIHERPRLPGPNAQALIIFLTFAVIFFTLVGEGLSLPALIHRLGLSDGGADAEEEIRARLVAAKAALAEIDALAGEDWTPDEKVQRMRNLYEDRKRRFAAQAGKIEDDGYEDRSLAYQQMVQLVLGAQRDALLRIRSEGKLSNEVMNRILHELDLEESRLEI